MSLNFGPGQQETEAEAELVLALLYTEDRGASYCSGLTVSQPRFQDNPGDSAAAGVALLACSRIPERGSVSFFFKAGTTRDKTGSNFSHG